MKQDETISSKKIRMNCIDNAIGFKEMKSNLDKFLKMNNFSDMEIRSIYHLMNSLFFMGTELK